VKTVPAVAVDEGCAMNLMEAAGAGAMAIVSLLTAVIDPEDAFNLILSVLM
jgi:hypothetical protein